MNNPNNIFLVLGPSGVGKSSFGEYLGTERNWLHLEIDKFPDADGIDIENLRRPWDLFFESKNASDLSAELRSRTRLAGRAGCVLSFPSGVVLWPEHILAAENETVTVVCLYGSAAHCINAFLERERKSGRELDLNHWLHNNRDTYLAMSYPVFEPYRIHVFDDEGRRKPHETVLGIIQTRSRT